MGCKKHYAERGEEITESNLYFEHIDAMTTEGLHSKRRVAAELAFRDLKILGLELEIRRLKNLVDGRDVNGKLMPSAPVMNPN